MKVKKKIFYKWLNKFEKNLGIYHDRTAIEKEVARGTTYESIQLHIVKETKKLIDKNQI